MRASRACPTLVLILPVRSQRRARAHTSTPTGGCRFARDTVTFPAGGSMI
nr:MAG: hypothetical protein [Molluscum contagiosum virus]